MKINQYEFLRNGKPFEPTREEIIQFAEHELAKKDKQLEIYKNLERYDVGELLNENIKLRQELNKIKQGKTLYAIEYDEQFVKSTKYEDGECKSDVYCKHFYEIPRRTKQEAISICNSLNASDFFSQNGAKMFNIVEIKESMK